MEKVILLLKGFIIGLAKIIPGVSGSLVALNLGLYEKGITAINSFFKDIKNNILFLSNIGMGILLAIMFGSKIINELLIKIPYLTMIVFIGLLIGSDISFLKNVKTKREKRYMIVTFFIMVSLFFVKTNINYTYKDDTLNNMYVIFLGFIDATTMIVPAISGTVIFMLLGSYDFILSIFSNMFDHIKIMIFFFMGLLIGIILITKLMDKLLRSKKEIFYSIINGFFLSSMIFMIFETSRINHTLIDNIITIPLLYISYKVGTLSNK